MGKFEMSKTKTISLTVGAFVAGALISLHFPALADKEVKPGLPIDELRTFAEVYSAIKQGYVEPVEDKKMITNAISGMLSNLDPHSAYLDADAFKDLQVGTQGEFGGLGIEVGMEDGYVKVISPIEDSPAFRAGIKAGDLITRLDSTPVKGLTLSPDLALVNLEGTGLIGVPGTAERVFAALRNAKVSVVMISQGSSEHSICCVVRAEQAERAREAVSDAFRRELDAKQLSDVALTRDIADKVLDPIVDQHERDETYPDGVFATLGAAGLLSLPYPEEWGGGAQPYEVYLQVLEELAARWAAVAVAVSVHSLACHPLTAFGTDEQKQRWLPDMLGGSTVGAYSLSEPQAGSDAAALACKATPSADGRGYVINGSKAWITHGGIADFYNLFARTGEGSKGISCFLVPKGTEGLSFGKPEEKMGLHAVPTTAAHYDNAAIESFGVETDFFK